MSAHQKKTGGNPTRLSAYVILYVSCKLGYAGKDSRYLVFIVIFITVAVEQCQRFQSA